MAKAIGGQLGNKNAVKNKPWREALDRAMKRDTRKRLDAAAEAVLDAAATGDLNAIRELGNRLDGRPMQAVEVIATDSVVERMKAAEKRLRTFRNGVSPAKVSGDAEMPDWLQ